MPTPIQGLRLGNGQAVDDVGLYDFTSLGEKSKGKMTITPPDGEGVWLTKEEARRAQDRWGYRWGDEWNFWDDRGNQGCPWAGHGVWVLSLRRVFSLLREGGIPRMASHSSHSTSRNRPLAGQPTF